MTDNLGNLNEADARTIIDGAKTSCSLNNCYNCNRAKGFLEGLAQGRSEREWMCDKCSTVYSGPPQKGASCVVCPKCGGDTAPKETILIWRLKAELTAERERGRALVKALQYAADGSSHCCEDCPCGYWQIEAEQALAAYQEGEKKP